MLAAQYSYLKNMENTRNNFRPQDAEERQVIFLDWEYLSSQGRYRWRNTSAWRGRKVQGKKSFCDFSQNHRVWKGPLETESNPTDKTKFPKVGWAVKHTSRSWISPKKKTPGPSIGKLKVVLEEEEQCFSLSSKKGLRTRGCKRKPGDNRMRGDSTHCWKKLWDCTEHPKKLECLE